MELLPIILILAWSGLKFMVGVGLTFLYNYSFLESLILAVVGGMLGIFVFSTFGRSIKLIKEKYFPSKKKRKIFTRKNRFIVRLRQSYGLAGIAFLTPLVLTVPVGAILATAIYKDKARIYSYMFVSLIFWGIVLVGPYHFFGFDLAKVFFSDIGFGQ